MPRSKRELRRLTDDESEMVERNMGLVGFVVKQRKSKAMEHKDQFQIGYVALIKAAQTFDASKGVAFSTYAIKCINSELYNSTRKANQIRIPAYLQAKNASTRKHFVDAVQSRKLTSLDAVMENTGDHPAVAADVDPICEREAADMLHRAIDSLSRREQDVVRGIDLRGETLLSLGRRHSVHRTMITYIRSQAHQKLREKLQTYVYA